MIISRAMIIKYTQEENDDGNWGDKFRSNSFEKLKKKKFFKIEEKW